ncbi:glycosyltransferase family 2 protein [Rhodalgimonas zhirmunskyi]|uniref:Glycosyltransferase n=1 Tax=Rhodalgimonas zhirmunskyi TaxID=2964767 RepID=A0AAJ1U8B1_9RHOB|nr:glycosyltransferase [Rhodoalgimonas zhirmunskyi]MDQ2093168.1 glycosyltransferase [Rhodoalgimonas zhirmunskyi]
MPGMSVIIPASNEEAYIGRCLDFLLASNPKPGAGSGSIPLPMPVEVIVVANACSDATAEVAGERAGAFRRMGWDFRVLDLAKGGKPNALNAGDKAAKFDNRVYLDADVTLSPKLLDQIGRALEVKRPAYVSGRCVIAPAKSLVTKLYAKTYAYVPFMRTGVPGCGLFAVNAAGRRRWKQFPDIISDDTFVRLIFSPQERIGVNAPYRWPLVEGWDALVRVRARQNKGVREVFERFPQLKKNDDKPRMTLLDKLMLFARNPLGFGVYAGVAMAARKRRATEWSRGR